MWEFVSGPLVWIAFAGLFGGLAYRLVTMAKLAHRERVVYPTLDAKYGARSLLHWLIPFAGRKMRLKPLYTIISFGFHICLLLTPLLVAGHVLLFEQSWGFRWWTLPEEWADGMTLVVIAACVFFILRRLLLPEVRNVTYPSDFFLAGLVLMPFATGYIAHQQWLPYRPMLIVHGLSGALCLLLIPWTRLVHLLWFAFTRAFMGSEFGSVRHARDW
ncbi:MAG: nitrate reductase [Acidobacteria bacterium]|nr:nitrate reductase [Acidobacteriota bacterium]